MYKLIVTPDRLSKDPGKYEVQFPDVYTLRMAFDHRFAMAVQHCEYDRIEAYSGEKLIALYDRGGIQ